MLIAFHASVIFTSIASWFIDGKFWFAGIDSTDNDNDNLFHFLSYKNLLLSETR